MPYVYERDAAGNFVCNICGVTKARQNTMHYHYRRHEDHLPYECDICHKEFLQASVLALHKAARHGGGAAAETSGGVACPACEFRTLTKANCIIHYVRRHCADCLSGPAPSLVCPGCAKVCKSRTALLYHLGTSDCMPRRSDGQKAHLDALKSGGDATI